MVSPVKFGSTDDNEVIRELLPYVHPHEGVLRAQLHREQHVSTEELRFIFSFSCAKCDHKSSVGYQVGLSMVRREHADKVLSSVADRLRAYCEELRNVPCLGQEDMSMFAQRVTEMLMMHGTMTTEEFTASWETWFPQKPVHFAKAVARHLGFAVPGGDYYALPADHPWRSKTPPDWE